MQQPILCLSHALLGMPELPEVETTRLSFAHRIAGAQISQLRMGKPLRWPLGVAPELLQGKTVLAVRRRGKYLLLDLDEGLLLLHLGMSGSLSFQAAQPPAGPHDHLDLYTSRGVLRLNDPRRFGAAVYAPLGEADAVAQKLLGNLGVEPFDAAFTPQHLHAALRGKSASIKQVLLAGKAVVGVGNIYASEALFLAGIRPTQPAGRISLARATRLHAAIQTILQRALDLGGSTLRNFSNAKGEAGYFMLDAAVYGRAGEPCKTCGAAITHIVQGQRSSYYCKKCQH